MSIVAAKYRGTKEFFQVYTELINATRYNGVVTYKRVAHLIGIDTPGNYMAREVGHVLGEISEEEVAAGRPMLSAVAVGSDGYPGEGFFTLARDLGLLSSKNEDEIYEFWENQKKRVYETWYVD